MKKMMNDVFLCLSQSIYMYVYEQGRDRQTEYGPMRVKMTLCLPCGPAGYLTGLYIILLDEL